MEDATPSNQRDTSIPYRVQYFGSETIGCHGCSERRYEKIRIAKIVYSNELNVEHDDIESALEWYHETCFFEHFQPRSTCDFENFESLFSKDQTRIRNTIEKMIPLKDVATNEHIRHVLLYMFHNGTGPTEAVRTICQVYGPNTFSVPGAQKWYRRFRNGDYAVKDQPKYMWVLKESAENNLAASSSEEDESSHQRNKHDLDDKVDQNFCTELLVAQDQRQEIDIKNIKKERDADDISFAIEYTKSSRGNCTMCDKKFGKADLRISKTDNGNKRKVAWHHVECFAKARHKYGYSIEGKDLLGFDKLSKEHRQLVVDSLPSLMQSTDEAVNSIMPEIKIEIGDTEYITPNINYELLNGVKIKEEKDPECPPIKQQRIS